MASKLFGAVVGVGLAMAAGTTVACLGSDPSSTSGADSADGAAGDAPADAILDAFCDAAWPTTKGSPGGPTCGSTGECADAGPAPYCYRVVDPAAMKCEQNGKEVPAWCVDRAWRCSTGSAPALECR
ncbi:MAG: hypothetical protein JST00_06980 [Deltaproteobacteria bacterium]|nr:hypothetical protein [Deltaproteobacteria bacterium]